VLRARMRVETADFMVDEQLGFAPDGHGEHLFLRVEKRHANTPFVARELARWAGIDERGVGYAGLKDRHALTIQTFSLHLPGREPPAEWPEHSEFRVLQAQRHSRKLPRGALAGNRFCLTLREVVGERGVIDARIAEIASRGFPNYFGEQRFGRGGGNLEAAQRMFDGARVKREERSILLSAARSAIFNAVLARRVLENNWASGLDGEIWMLDGTHSVFGPESLNAELHARAARADIHPTGPMWGSGALRSALAAREIEEACAVEYVGLCAGLQAAGLKQERRALRCMAVDLGAQWIGDDVLRLEVFLPAGAYATALLTALGDFES